ncbi:hypothetical protein [Ancylobacter pratisalsi]|nr:hypothetical protein [Ancylobacter pratisalsi]
MDDTTARSARVKPLVWRIQNPHTTDLVSGETVVLLAMVPWGAVAITKALKETGYRVCEGASRAGGFASIEEAREWAETGYQRMMAAAIELDAPAPAPPAALSVPAAVMALWEETAGRPWPQAAPLGPEIEAMMADGWIRLAGKSGGSPSASTAMLQWTRAAQIAMSRTDAI